MSAPHPFRAPLLLSLLALLIAVLTPALASAKPAPAPVVTTATHIAITSVDTPAVSGAPVTAGSPTYLVVRGTPFTVAATFLGADEAPAPLSTNKAVTVTLAALAASGTRTTLATSVVPVGQTAVSFTGAQIAAAANNVRLQVSTVAKKPADVISGDSVAFDVLKSALVAGTSSTLTGIGAGGGTGTMCDPTAKDPVCADLLLPDQSRVTSSNLLLSLGVCDQFIACDSSGSVVQALVGLAPGNGTPAATLVMKCDKALCGGNGVPSFHLLVDLTYGGAPTTDFAPPCPDKGVIGPDQAFCVDYVQSTRANAGDLYLFLLLDEDARVRFP